MGRHRITLEVDTTRDQLGYPWGAHFDDPQHKDEEMRDYANALTAWDVPPWTMVLDVEALPAGATRYAVIGTYADSDDDQRFCEEFEASGVEEAERAARAWGREQGATVRIAAVVEGSVTLADA